MADHYVITIARGFGSGGKEIGSLVAKKLGIHCYEHRILTLASELSGLDRTRFLESDERLKATATSYLLSVLPRSVKPVPVNGKFKAQNQLFDYQQQIIKMLADHESCVIVGKCADYVLRDRANVFSFYIEAPRAFCVKRVMQKMNCTEAEAHKMIEETDRYRAEYYKYYTKGNYWTNPVNYDLTINSEKMGIDNAVDLMINYLKIREAIKE